MLRPLFQMISYIINRASKNDDNNSRIETQTPNNNNNLNTINLEPHKNSSASSVFCPHLSDVSVRF